MRTAVVIFALSALIGSATVARAAEPEKTVTGIVLDAPWKVAVYTLASGWNLRRATD